MYFLHRFRCVISEEAFSCLYIIRTRGGFRKCICSVRAEGASDRQVSAQYCRIRPSVLCLWWGAAKVKCSLVCMEQVHISITSTFFICQMNNLIEPMGYFGLFSFLFWLFIPFLHFRECLLFFKFINILFGQTAWAVLQVKPMCFITVSTSRIFGAGSSPWEYSQHYWAS